MAYLGVGINFRYNFRFKSSPYLKMVAILKISNYMFILTSDMETSSEIMPEKSTFDFDDVTDDVTALRQIRPSIFMFK